MRLLLLSLLLLHTLAWGDVIHPTEGVISLNGDLPPSLDLLQHGVDSSRVASPEALFWLPLLTTKTQTQNQQRILIVDNKWELATSSPHYWQQPSAEKSWPLPEPSTLLLFGAGILLVLIARHVRLSNQRKKTKSLPEKP